MSHLYFILLKLSIIFCAICLCNITNSSNRLLPLFRCLRREGKTLYLPKPYGPVPKKVGDQGSGSVPVREWTKAYKWNYCWASTGKITDYKPYYSCFIMAALKPNATITIISLYFPLQKESLFNLTFLTGNSIVTHYLK